LSIGQPVEILNQIAETRRVRDLAEMVAKKAGAKISYVNNPRNEAAENELEVSVMSLLNVKFINY
jgi:UDP-sulfoquinovose synthase